MSDKPIEPPPGYWPMGREDRGPDGAPVVVGYMCATDWSCELGSAADGNKVYPSVEALKRELSCVADRPGGCGIVEVEVRFLRVVQKCRDTEPPEEAVDERNPLAAPVSAWQPIETAPRDGSWILGVSAGNVYPMRWLEVDGHSGLDGWYPPWVPSGDLTAMNHGEEQSTHWQPLPPPPKEAGG